MADYVTAIRTVNGDKQIDYNYLANTPNTATTTTKGLMSAKDKVKLESIAQNFIVEADITIPDVGNLSPVTLNKTFDEILAAYEAGHNLQLIMVSTGQLLYFGGVTYASDEFGANLTDEVEAFYFNMASILGYGHCDIYTITVGKSAIFCTHNQGLFVPMPSSSDAGKVLTANDDGTASWV